MNNTNTQGRASSNKSGFTLLEISIVMVILSIVSVILVTVNLTMIRATLFQESITELRDEGRLAMQEMTRSIRLAPSSSLRSVFMSGGTIETDIFTGEPVSIIAFNAVTDADGNGVAIDVEFELEVTDPIIYGVDPDDPTKLSEFDPVNNVVVRELTSNLNPQGGATFRRVQGGVQIRLNLFKPANGLRPPTRIVLTQVVSPRN